MIHHQKMTEMVVSETMEILNAYNLLDRIYIPFHKDTIAALMVAHQELSFKEEIDSVASWICPLPI